MSFDLLTSPLAQCHLKKLPQDVRKYLDQAFQSLGDNPYQGQPLQGKLHILRSLHTRYKNTDYRIAYQIIEKRKAIVIWYAASRENFYRQLEKLL